MSRPALARLQAMSLTTQITSVTVEVADQDRALAFYRDILGCEVRADVEVWPGARWLEVAPPGSDVGIALLTRASGLPLGVRYGTVNADGAHERLVGAGVQPHQDVLRTDYAPPMFTLADPDGNTIILIEDEEPAPHAG
jgi:catechol 2,3-dioxygenase-like lactoylglutathione lyase family enzyme